MIGSVIATDIDNDGNKEIFAVVSDGDNSSYGAIIGLHHDGIELFDIDGNVTTKSGFAKFTSPLGATPAVAPLDNSGKYKVVMPTRNIENVSANLLACYAVEDNDGNHLPDSIWQKTGYGSASRGAVIANIDNSSDGSNEIVLVSGNTLRVLNNTGTQIASKGSAFSFSAPAVADLDNDGYKEIIATDANNLYVWKNVMGTNRSLQTVFTKSGYNFISSPVICDLDNDGTKEILITIKNGSISVVYALKPNGTPLSGWNGTQTATYINNWYSHDLSVGDLNGDGNLEVVILGKDTVKVWRNDGTLLKATAVPGLSPGKNVPILADVDGNPGAEIIFGSATQNYIYALDINGNLAPGFPLQVDDVMESSVCVADIDNNGKNDLIAATGGFVYMWETDGTSDNIQWGMERADNCNTGEYKPVCPPEIITGSTTWNDSREQCGNLTVQAGTLTLAAGCTLSMTGSSVITVQSGATLTVDGGTVENADIKVLSGGKVILKNNGTIKLRDNGAFFSEKGAIFVNFFGKVLL
ncbi:MAG: VCBS repeat-containing protein [Bacteroidales bacterium]|nr:VCBS repeat-containing protein [Bacteroidales bacterium]